MRYVIKTIAAISSLALALALPLACGNPEKKDRDFHTSGSREADQRAEQRVAKVQQLRGEGSTDDGDKTVKKALFDRLGGEAGIAQIVEDWVNRSLADPRVNYERKGVSRGGFSLRGDKSVEWSPTPENGTRLKKHYTQFLSLASGGPPVYEGRDIPEVHSQMKISNAEFDAAVGDLKATLDRFAIGTEEQKELLSVIESTRPQIATKR